MDNTVKGLIKFVRILQAAATREKNARETK